MFLQTDMLLLKTLLKISYAFATAPYYDFQTKQIRKFKLYTFYSSCTLLLIVTGFLYSCIFISGTGDGSSQSQQIGNLLEMLSSLLLAISALIAVSASVFMSKKWTYLFEELQNVDVKLGCWENDAKTNQNNIYLKLLLIYLPKLCKDVYCIFVCYDLGRMPKYLVCNIAFEYYCLAPTLLIVFLGLTFKDKYKVVMQLLKNHQTSVLNRSESKFVITELLKNNTTCDNYLRGTSKMFRLLNSILENYNFYLGISCYLCWATLCFLFYKRSTTV